MLIEVSTGDGLTKILKSSKYSQNRIIEPMFGHSSDGASLPGLDALLERLDQMGVWHRGNAESAAGAGD